MRAIAIPMLLLAPALASQDPIAQLRVKPPAAAGDVEKGIDGLNDLEQGAAEIRTRLASDELAPELAAKKALLELERPLHERGVEAVPHKALARLVEKHANTMAAARPQRLMVALGAKL